MVACWICWDALEWQRPGYSEPLIQLYKPQGEGLYSLCIQRYIYAVNIIL